MSTKKTILLLLLSLTLIGVSFLIWHRKPVRIESPQATDATVQAAQSASLAPNISRPGLANSSSSLNLAPQVEILWENLPSEPAFALFHEWANQYARTPESEKPVLEAEGIALARARLTALADLIQTNPERSLQLAVPHAVRDSLPDSIKPLLEERVNTRADYHVLAVLPVPGSPSGLPPVIRSAQINNEEYEVFTFGPALGYMTKPNAPLNGLAVPASAASALPANPLLAPARLLALDPNPARQLESDELPAATRQEPICSASGKPSIVGVQLGGRIKTFCGVGHAQEWVEQTVAAAGLTSPATASDLPIAESSYTEGRKRFLLMRPGFTDLTNTMSDTQVPGHFANFSNYMYSLSYGKMVFAGLGQGSDYTPIMRLPGVASDYDNKALSSGGLYDTCKSVAQSTYGFNIGQYDFLYVVTAGSSPAYSYAGLGFVGGVGFHLANGYFSQGTASHEFGHNLGLNHANFWSTGARSIIGAGSSVEYGDGNDPMGGASGEPEHYNSRYMNYLNWIRDTDIANITSSGLFRLYAFDGVDLPGGLRGLKFTRNSSQNYWVHFRQRYTSKSMANGVQVLWTGNQNQSSLLLDIRRLDNSGDNALVIGRTLSDTSLGLHITPLGKGNTYPESMDVMVNVGSFPGNLPPTVTVSASSTNAGTGIPITFNALGNDPNNDTPLAYWWDFGDGDYSVDNKATATHSFGTAGEYLVQCTVSDLKGGIGRESLIMRIGSPSSFRIAGRVFDSSNRPLTGVKVSADSSHSALSDSDGSYTIVGLNAGSYLLDAQEPVANVVAFAHPFFVNPVSIGPNAAGKDFLIGTSAPPIMLVSTGEVWKYLDDGSNQGTGWIDPSFDDTVWKSGRGQFGYGEGDETTTNSFGPDSTHKYITYYYRHPFNVADASVLTNVVLSLLRDDGGIVYLNGVEVFRSNMPNGPVTYTTFAATTASDDGKTWFITSLSPSLLVTGTNVLAVEIHQSDLTSSDISFDLSLTSDSTANLTRASLVYLTSPADGDTFAAPTSITISAIALSTIAGVTNVEFFDGAGKVGENDTPPFTFSWNAVPEGLHALRAVADLEGGIRVTSAPVTVQVIVPQEPPISVSLVETGSVWKYYANNAAPSGSWTTLTYNDTVWASGPAIFGYGQGDEATVIPYGNNDNNKWITSYYRKSFIAPDPGGMTNLLLQLKRDDGAVVYVNGTEVIRNNMPAGPVLWGTLATADAPDDGQVFLPFNLDPSALIPGTNVVAVEIHQSSVSSSDLTFDLGLTGQAVTNRSRGIWLTAPGEGANISLPGSVNLAAQAVMGGSLSLLKIDFYIDGLKLSQDSTPPYTAVWNNPVGGPHQLMAVALDSNHDSITSAPVNINVIAAPPGEAIISFGDVWKYQDDGSNQGSNWVARTFDDRMWAAGPSRFGYGGDGEVTTISYGPNSASRYLTAYFRKAFTVPNPAIYAGFLLRLVRDDGAVVYLNGVEIYRNNLLPGRVSWNSLATANVTPPDETTPIDLNLNTAAFLPGTNILAVEIHQVSINSEDAGFNLALIGQRTNNPAPSVYLTSPAEGTHFNSPANVPLSAFAPSPAGALLLVEYFDGDAFIGQASVSPYNVTWVNAPIGSHALTARVTDNGGLQTTSAVVNITVGPRPALILPISETLISAGSTWSFWDNSTAVGAGWQTLTFDDSLWPMGTARFGWGLDGEKTTLTSGRITHYFRRWFTITNPLLLTELTFQLQRDDGAVVYLNGVEVFRSNMPGGTITSSTLASATVNTPDETTFYQTILALSSSTLRLGSNLVAVELHQATAGSSDAGFDLQLLDYGTTEQRIALTKPLNNQRFMLPTVIPMAASAWGGYGADITKVEFYADNSKVGEATTAPYEFQWYDPPFGAHSVLAVLKNSNGFLMTSAPVNVTVSYPLGSSVLITSNSVWKYLDDGSDQGTNWTQRGYDDSGWRSNIARFGYGGEGEETVLNFGPDSANKYMTYYFRRWFTIPDTITLTNLYYLILRDDGAVGWLNGGEVFRSNMPLGPVNYLTAATNVLGSPSSFIAGIILTNALVPGSNLLAIELHQSSPVSADAAFDLELDANGYTLPPPPALTIDGPVAASGENQGSAIRLSWSMLSASWNLYASSELSPSAVWVPVETPPFDTNGVRSVTVPLENGGRFYRLQKP